MSGCDDPARLAAATVDRVQSADSPTPTAGPSSRWWPGLAFSAVWLIYLQEPYAAAWAARDTVRGAVGLLTLTLFALGYLVSFTWARHLRVTGQQVARRWTGQLLVAAMGLLSAVACWAVGQEATTTFVFLAVALVQWFRTKVAAGLVLGLVFVAELLSQVVPGWTREPALIFSIVVAAFAMWGFTQLLLRNVDLLAAREENARLAVQEERNRFARDLHDILGHSLTVITVKAELAQRLLEAEPDRARAELVDVERLSRDALADVRRAVSGFREPSLAAELVRAKDALVAAGIRPELPSSVDGVPSRLQELFAWTVREGVTNVIRHSGASRCQVSLAAGSLRVDDDGSGAPGPDVSRGHGLAGLGERATAAGAVLVTTALQPRGFRLEVTVP